MCTGAIAGTSRIDVSRKTSMPKRAVRERRRGPNRRQATTSPCARVAWRELRDKVRSADVVVIHAAVYAPPEPDIVLTYFKLFAAGTAWLDLRTFDPADSINGWIEAENARLGHKARGLRPGYHLFAAGNLRAYASGILDLRREVRSFGIGVLTWLLGTEFDVPFLRDSAFIAARAEAASHVIGGFYEILRAQEAPNMPPSGESTGPGSAPRRSPPPRPPPPPPPTPIDELALACATLGVTTDAAHAAVKSRYRELAKDWHPDRFVGDATRAREASVRMTQINLAYAVICQARGWS